MTEEGGIRDSSNKSNVPNEASQTRQRKKRKWDQPAESLVSAGLVVPGVLPVGNMGSLSGITTPIPNSLAASCVNVPQVIQAPLIQQHTAAVVPKLNQPKIQDELIAREIIINDAESSVRYKLTKRQTQEEIQKCTGAVVITRGKYRLPNAPPDGEKPLYLHISAGAHLKDMAERILAVDRAAAMVEEMLNEGQIIHPVSSTFQAAVANDTKDAQPFSTSVLLGFVADPSLNIAARIRGPNDQYINHIMNETGATVLLRGCGSGNTESPSGEGQQQLHLFLSSSNSKSLNDAKRLAENLLDTISVECGVSRFSSSKAYSAVPPPQQVYSAVPPPQTLLTGVQNSQNDVKASMSSNTGLPSSTMGVIPTPIVSSVGVAGISTIFSQGKVPQSGGLLVSGQSQADMVSYPQPVLSGGTSYSGYGGIYPQATPLQQVALALRQSSSPITSSVAPRTSLPSTEPKLSLSSDSEKEKRPPQRRKFQELPVGSKVSVKHNQVSEYLKPIEPSAGLGVRNVSNMPAPKKLISSTTKGRPKSPPRMMPPPPPPPKFSSPTSSVKVHDKNSIMEKTKSDSVPDTLFKLMEYGEDDEDSEEASEESLSSISVAVSARKPFWAL
ncbi:hypothetical protein FNV43_RR14550 [Rhamnella rubrinervis]|uniref:Protein RIK n=1 Tax=Rhamnella rubrinervis TaxID=2594499 RepID=A0A8K0H308_9ROSA|nr:hypothetical protein FNV43_RR14550 [Rhamnella rubrinervis]